MPLYNVRHLTAALFTSTNPTLNPGEFGCEVDTGLWKCGDGATAWTSLTYVPVPTAAPRTWTAVLGGVGFKNSWGNDAGYTPAAFRLARDGKHVEMAGGCIGGSNSIAFTLPVVTPSLIPLTKKFLNGGYVTVDTSGNVLFPSTFGALDGISYPLDI